MLFFLLPHELVGDATTRFPDIETLLHEGRLTDSRFSLVMPIFSAPFLLVGEVIRSPEWWATRFNVIVVAAGSVVVFRLLRGRIDEGVLRKSLLVLLFASLLTNRLREYGPEIFTATLVVIGIAMLTTGRSELLGWGAIVVGVVSTPAAIVALALLAAAETIRTRRLRHLAPLAVAAMLIAAESWIRRGGPFVTGYESDHGYPTVLPYSGRSEWSYPFLLGLASILFSFGRGLLFFTPGLVLWLSARTRRLARPWSHGVLLMLLFVAGLVLVYSKWWAWYGGIAWGPRFFVFAAVPASFAIALRLRRGGTSPAADALTLVVLALSAWVGLSGAISDLSALQPCREDRYALESMCWYVPEFSSLWRPVLDFPSLSTATSIVVAYWAVVVAWLAVPLVAGLVRSLGARLHPAAWLEGWRL